MTGPAAIDGEHWQRRLTALAGQHRVPGAVVGILRLDGTGGAESVTAHAGVLNKATGVPVTDRSVFQLGSITKVWTATVAMQLVDEGRLALDAPIHEVIPELELADPDATARVTLRHLLSHTSGIDGDLLVDAGRGDDCLERYVARFGSLRLTSRPGATFSYCNCGYSLVGRVIEKLTGTTWDQAMSDRLLTPLGLTHTGTLPEHAILHGVAVGHVGGDGAQDPEPATVWVLPRALGPAGLITASADDVLAFARMQLSGGLAVDGRRVLSRASAELMTQHQTDVADPYLLGDSWGLGWTRFDWNGHRLIGHDGTTIGQSSFLRVLPDRSLAVILLTNGGRARELYLDLFGEIFGELAGVTPPKPLAPATEPLPGDVSTLVGTYERSGATLTVEEREGGLRLRARTTGPLMALGTDPLDVGLYPVTGDLFAYQRPGTHGWNAVAFYRLPDGQMYLHTGAQAFPRVSRAA